MELSFDLVQTMGLAAAVFFIGKFLKSKIPAFQKYFIPAPVIGGLLFSLLIFIGVQTGAYAIGLDTTLQDFCMNLFFTCTGFTCSIAVIKRSGWQGLVLAVVAVAFLFVQNLVGIVLSGAFGLNKLLGVAMGSISMSGGVGSGASFGPTLEALGAEAGTTVGVAAATFGLLAGSIVGGPVAGRLIRKYNLKSAGTAGASAAQQETAGAGISSRHIFTSVILVLVAAALGSYLQKAAVALTGLSIPYYVGCLFSGLIFRNVADAAGLKLNEEEIDIIGTVSLNLFLSLALMSLNIAKLISLAVPMIVILLAQTAVMVLWAYFVTFRSMGGDYEAAVMAAGHCGVGLGQTPNAVANMAAVIEKNGPAPNAWFVLPVITVIFINVFNPIVITLFINWIA